MQDNRVQEYIIPSRPSIKCNVLRESLSEDNHIPCATLKKRGCGQSLYISGNSSVVDPDTEPHGSALILVGWIRRGKVPAKKKKVKRLNVFEVLYVFFKG